MAKSKTLTFAEVADAKGIRYDEVPTPELGEGTAIRIGSLTAGDVVEWAKINREEEEGRQAGLHLFIRAWVNDQGDRIGRLEHIDMLKTKDARAIGRVINVIMKMNGLGRWSDDEGVKSKNVLSETPSGVSHTP